MQVEPPEHVSDAFKKGVAKLQSNAYRTFCFGTLHDPIGLAVGVKLRGVCDDDKINSDDADAVKDIIDSCKDGWNLLLVFFTLLLSMVLGYCFESPEPHSGWSDESALWLDRLFKFSAVLCTGGSFAGVQVCMWLYIHTWYIVSSPHAVWNMINFPHQSVVQCFWATIIGGLLMWIIGTLISSEPVVGAILVSIAAVVTLALVFPLLNLSIKALPAQRMYARKLLAAKRPTE